MVRAVLFDLYDTLAYVDAPVVVAGRRRLAELAAVAPEAFEPLWRETRDLRMLGRLATLEEQFRYFLERLGLAAPAELLDRLAAVETETWRQAVHLYPGVAETLAELRRRGYRLGLLSNCSAQAGAVVRQLGLDRLLDALTLSCEVGLMKPDPAIYRHALGQLGAAPAEAVFVADGAFNELDAARSLGLYAVRIVQPRQSTAYGSSDGWDAEIGSLPELLPLLGRLEERRPATG